MINTQDFRDGLLTPDVAERPLKYGGPLHSKVERLPVPSTAADAAACIGEPVNSADAEWALQLVTELDAAYKAMHIGDVGEVVTELPELDFSIRAEL